MKNIFVIVGFIQFWGKCIYYAFPRKLNKTNLLAFYMTSCMYSSLHGRHVEGRVFDEHEEEIQGIDLGCGLRRAQVRVGMKYLKNQPPTL